MDIQSLFIGVLTGIVGTYIVYRLRVMPEEQSRSYFKGWVDRHQAKPLLPRYWKHGNYLCYEDPVEQQMLRVLWNSPGGTYEDRLEQGLPPGYTHSRVQYAISNKELEILNDSAEKEWRGLYDTDDVTRHPWSPSVRDVRTLLEMEFETVVIEQYYRVRNLQLLRNRLGRLVKVKWDRMLHDNE
ncbi:MAG: hypothetical protein IH914_09995 [candidate division Zixibacteria bacterium]|nr:hypothetical protein [candidate division Zixibacteria bacterium]